MADCTHILGWSRELIHSLPHSPNWLMGHAFRRQEDGTYQVSGSDQKVREVDLIAWAKEAQSLLAKADVTLGQWNDTSHEDWPEAIKREHDKVIQDHSGKFHRAAIGDDVKFHVLRCNAANEVHCPEYPNKD